MILNFLDGIMLESAKKIEKFFLIFLAAFKKCVFLQPIWMSNGVMAAQLTLDQLV